MPEFPAPDDGRHAPAESLRPSYSSPLRARQKLATRELILEAVGQCLQDRGLEDIAYADLAARAGVAERTLYRHFPTKAGLLDAFWQSLHQRLGIAAFPGSAAELIDLPRQVFPFFDQHEQVLRGMLASPQGREVRLAVNDERQAAIRQAVRDAVGDTLAEPAFTRLCAAVQLLYSASGWLTMKDYWGLSGEEAGIAASEAIASLLRGAAAPSPSPAS